MKDSDRLKKIIDEIPEMISANIPSWDPRFQAWKTKAERYLAYKYGKESIEYQRFIGTRFTLGAYSSRTPHSAFIEACQRGLKTCQVTFQAYLDEMLEDDLSEAPAKSPASFSKVFIVHGHDSALRESVARIIEKQDIEAIILSEQANKGRTIIEKFEDYGDVSGAICLFTADDVGKAKGKADEMPRARQNVVFETGYFMGKLGRDHIVLLADKGVEMPSDLSGVVHTNTDKWTVALLQELKAMGYAVDFNKLF